MKLGVGILVASVALASINVFATTLEQSFQLALQRSETIGLQSEVVTQAEEKIVQARATIFPKITGVASYQVQDRSGLSALGTNISPGSQPLIKVMGTQPLFRGFRDFAALKQVKKLAAAQTLALQQAKATLYEEVAVAFYQRLSAEEEVRNLEEEQKSYEARIKELEGRVRIGRSRPNEVLLLNANVESVRAQIEQARGALMVAIDTLQFLTGLDATAKLEDELDSPAAIEDLSALLAAVVERPEVRAEKEKIESAQSGLWVARGQYLPELDFTGNYYFLRAGVTENVDWDFNFMLNWPLFGGFSTQSKIREAFSLKQQAQLNLQLVTRRAEENIRVRYHNLMSTNAQLKAWDRAREAAEKSYQVEKQDYRLGLVTNLEVLQTLTTLAETERNRDRILFNSKLGRIQLDVAAGRRPKEAR